MFDLCMHAELNCSFKILHSCLACDSDGDEQTEPVESQEEREQEQEQEEEQEQEQEQEQQEQQEQQQHLLTTFCFALLRNCSDIYRITSSSVFLPE